MSVIRVGVAAVDEFNNNISQTSVSDTESFLENVWKYEIEDGTGNYSANFTGRYYDTVPVKPLCDDCDNYWERARNADDWLRNNWNDYSNYYASKDVIVVLDYHDNKEDHIGVAQSTAGTPTKKVVLVNAKEVKGDPVRSPDEIKKVAAHELFHMFIDEDPGYPDYSSEHYPHVTSTPRGDFLSTVMYDLGEIEYDCTFSGASADQVASNTSSCTRNRVRDFIDSNL